MLGRADSGFLILNAKDNVAVAITELKVGTLIEIEHGQEQGELRLLDDIPFGHKFALESIGVGETVVKYGQEIGVATQAIARGEHVHIHNLESRRGRGDWEKPRR